MAQWCTGHHYMTSLLLCLVLTNVSPVIYAEPEDYVLLYSNTPQFSVLQRQKRLVDLVHEDRFDHNLKILDDHKTYVINKKIVHQSVTLNITQLPQYEEIIIPSPTPLVCHDHQVQLANVAAKFTNCAIRNARPINICLGCVAEYNDTVFAYSQLIDASENGTRCKDILLSMDRLQVLSSMYGNILNIWSHGNCNSCYELSGSTANLSVVSPNTQHFMDVMDNVSECFEKMQLSHIKPNMDFNCTQCKSVYKHLSDIYGDYAKELKDRDDPLEMCADVFDAMNITHHLWNVRFRCKFFDANVDYFLYVVSFSMGSIPVIFYLAVKFLSDVETIQVFSPRRKYYVPDNAPVQM